MMKQSPVHERYQPRCYEAYEFDHLQEDFSEFLEEAKHHASEAAKLTSSSVHPEESGSGKEKRPKEKKSWKSSLISWLKADRKSKHSGERAGNSRSKVGAGKRRQHQQGHAYVSGPIYNCGNAPPDVKQWRPTSGPLTSLFKSTKRDHESHIPYMTLRQQDSPRALHNYGPLYVVT